MSNSQISTFNFKSFPVRVELFENEPHFCLADVCDILNIQNSRRVNSEMLDEKGVRRTYTLTKGGKQELTFINEPNLYRIIFKSRKAEAVEFQNWVFEEVLPQIRKTGSYLQKNPQIAPVAKKRGRPANNPFGCEEYSRNFTAKELEWLVLLWYRADKQDNFIKSLIPAFEAMGSAFLKDALRFSSDFIDLDLSREVVARIAEGADIPRFAPLLTLEAEQAKAHRQQIANF